MLSSKHEVIVVRSLTESDLGIFAAHRASSTSKQRAININAEVARAILSQQAVEAGGVELDCTYAFGEVSVRSVRRLGKSGKNWRLGGKKLNHSLFGELDSKDFVLIRTRAPNDGSEPVVVRFISKKRDRLIHAGLAAVIGARLEGSMTLVSESDESFSAFAVHCPMSPATRSETTKPAASVKRSSLLPSMPREPEIEVQRTRSVHEKLRSPHILEQMLRVAGDLSAPAQLDFINTVDLLATQLRTVLVATKRIFSVSADHASFWSGIRGQRVGFVDGGLANLSMLGSAPIAARVGGYSVVPGDTTEDRESFTTLKYLIDELYSSVSGGIYDSSFPDVSALRDAARIVIEAAGAVQMLSAQPDVKWLFLHGALVNPVSRYSDAMQDGRVRNRFPDFADAAVTDLLAEEDFSSSGRDRNFISVYLRQLERLSASDVAVCGVVEREGSTSSVCSAILDSLPEEELGDLLPVPPREWKAWFKAAISPNNSEDFEGQRITDSLLFRCVLEPGEVLIPVPVNRNDVRRAPQKWVDEIARYPKPFVSYIQPSEWVAPLRVEIFEKDLARFNDVASLVLHCSLLLPRYAFPVGLDIVDKFVKIPNWMSRPVNTSVAVQAMRMAMDNGDTRLVDALRRMLCGSGREFLLRPGILR